MRLLNFRNLDFITNFIHVKILSSLIFIIHEIPSGISWDGFHESVGSQILELVVRLKQLPRQTKVGDRTTALKRYHDVGPLGTKMTKTVNNPELSPLSSTFLWFHRPLWSALFFVAMTRDRDHASLCFIVIQKDLCWKSKSKCLVRPRELPLSSARQLFEWLDTAMFTFFSGSQLVPLAAGTQLTWCWNCNWPVTTKWAPKTIWMAKNQWVTGAFLPCF